jgi:hypothetical protein
MANQVYMRNTEPRPGAVGRRMKTQASKRQENASQKDLDILNCRADKLNAEAEDVL